MMEKYEMRRQIGPSICDASGKLSHAEAFGPSTRSRSAWDWARWPKRIFFG